MQKRSIFSPPRGERGQTIVLVAISMVSLLAMAALAIDVVTLYVARTEIQRAADIAALAGAKALADSGITSLPASDPNLTGGEAQTLAQSMANAAISAVLPNNLVAGAQPTQPSPAVYNFTTATVTAVNNPQVTVTLQQANLPTFFARIFGRTGASVQASATAEAYSPSNMSPFTPIVPRCVKPWLVVNEDPHHAPNGFITDPVNGVTESDAVGEEFWLRADCNRFTGPGCTLRNNPPQANGAQNYVGYVPAQVNASPGNYVCPSGGGSSDYAQSIQCCDTSTLYACGGTTASTQWDNTVNPDFASNTDTLDGVEALIHATNTGLGQGQDSISNPGWPANPLEITAGSGSGNPQNGNLVTTSSSIVTIPIIDPCPGCFPPNGGAVTVRGFMQAFVEQIGGGPSGRDIQVRLLNLAACGHTNNGSSPVLGGNGTATVPVRLVTTP